MGHKSTEMAGAYAAFSDCSVPKSGAPLMPCMVCGPVPSVPLVLGGQPLQQVSGPAAPTPPVGTVFFVPVLPSQGVPQGQPMVAFTAPHIIPHMQQQQEQHQEACQMPSSSPVVVEMSSEEPQWPDRQADSRPADGRPSLSNAATRRRRRQRAMQQARNMRAAAAEAEPSVGGGSSGFHEDVALAKRLSEALGRGTSDVAAALRFLQDNPSTTSRLAFQPAGCRAVQAALEVADRETAVQIARCLEGRVAEAMRSPHANYVVQLIIKVLQAEEVPFILEEIEAAGPELAFHEYGCRIYIRLLALGSLNPLLVRIIDDALSQVRELIRDPYGHYVVEAILEHGLPDHRRRVIAEIREDLVHCTRSRHSAHVIDKALQHGSPEERQELVDDFLALPPEELAALAKSQFGGMVLRTLQRLSGRFAELKASGRRSQQRAVAPT